MNGNKIIDGKLISSEIRDKIKKFGNELQNKSGKKPGLAVVLVGEHPASKVYVRNKIESNIVGKPMAALLLGMNATVTICHSKTRNLESVCSNADILVAAVGIPELVKSNWIKKNALVIDVGINRIERNNKKILVGDVDYEDCLDKCSKITPVPGGVGPMTIACLLLNTLLASYAQFNEKTPDFLNNFNLKAFNFIKPSASLWS